MKPHSRPYPYSLLQRRLWRWHFYAGLIVVPFALLLAITGSIYLFNAEYEHWFESRINATANKQVTDKPLTADQILNLAQAHYADGKFKKWIVAKSNDRSVEIELSINGVIYVLWVDQYTGDILHKTIKSKRFMSIIKKIHSELLLGDRGSLVVELMASWMIILLITGIVLWWPQNQAKQAFHVRVLRAFIPGSIHLSFRQGWRNLHGVTGIFLGLFILILLISGLPWTQVWGAGFKKLQESMQWDGPGQEWLIKLQSKQPNTAKTFNGGLELWQRSSTDQQDVTLQSKAPIDTIAKPITLQKILNTTSSQSLSDPVEIYPPLNDKGVWTVRSMTANRPKRETIHYDRWTGEEIMRIRFSDYHTVKKVTAYGIALHEGALFGLSNQLLGLITAIGILVLCISGVIMWWQRRPKGQIAAPPIPNRYKLKWPIIITIVIISTLLPMAALSIIFILIIEASYYMAKKYIKHLLP